MLKLKMNNNNDAKITFKKLREVVDYRKGKKPKNLHDSPNDSTIPYIDIEAFEKAVIRRYTDDKNVLISDKDKDILVVWDGARAGLVGNASGAVGSTLMKLTPKEVNKEYLQFFLTSKYQEINTNHRGTGIPHVNPDIFWEFDVPIPAKDIQQQIVSKIKKTLPSISDDIKRIDKVRKILQRLKQATLTAAVTGKLSEDWREKNINLKSAIAEAAFDIELPEIPNTWVWTKLGEITDLKGGVTKGRNLVGKKLISLPYLRVANVQDGYLDLSVMKRIEIPVEEKEKYLLLKGDILFTEGGDRDKLGRGTVWNNEITDCIHQNHIFRARVNNKEVFPEFITLVTKSSFAKTYFFDNASQTVNLASINITVLKGTPISLPPLEEQKEIIERVKRYFDVANKLEKQVEKAEKLISKLPQSILTKYIQHNEDISI